MLLERFCNYLKYEKRYSGYTLRAYSKDLEEFGFFLKSRDEDFSSAQPQSVRAWIVELMHRADARTINRKLSSLRSFYKFLNREDLITSNPVQLVKALKTSKRLPVVVKEAGINSLLDSDDVFPADFSGLRDKLIIELLFGTGIRLSELLFIKEVDINLYEQNIRIMGKRSKERIVPLNRPLCELIRQYIREKNNCHFESECVNLIVTSEGKKAYAVLIYRVVRRYLGYITTLEKRSPHVLRHSYATSLLDHGADLNAIKELLGHASLAATQVYTHNSVERLKSIYKQAHPKA